MSSIVNDEYTLQNQNQQDLYDAILNTLFPILLIKFIDLQWNKNERMMKRIELYKQVKNKTIIDNLNKRKNVSFGIDKCWNISKKNKQVLKDALIELIPNTIEDSGDDYRLENFEIKLKGYKKEILELEDDNNNDFEIKLEEGLEDGDDNEDFEIKLEEGKKEILDKKENLKILNEVLNEIDEILKEIEEERKAYFEISRVSTFRAIALPLLDDALYNTVTWVIPLAVAFAYDDLLSIKIFSFINMALHLTCSTITIFSKYLAKKFKSKFSKFFGYDIITTGDKGFCWTFKIKDQPTDSISIDIAGYFLVFFPVFIIPIFWIIVISRNPFDLISFVFLILFALLLLLPPFLVL
ncbi:17354_t:CDS:2, partial [Dentiscutata erythropus]